MTLVKGKRYAFYVSGKKHTGIFTGSYDEGMAYMVSKSGYVWRVPLVNFEKKEGKKS